MDASHIGLEFVVYSQLIVCLIMVQYCKQTDYVLFSVQN